MKLVLALGHSIIVLLVLSEVAGAQTPIVTVRLAKDQIATVKTAPGITTRLVFPEQVSEIICGDLYDPASGRGTFVIQRGGKDVFLKPVTTKGLSNMFVKTGQTEENVYSFDLMIVTADQAHRVVNVMDAQGVPVSRSMSPSTRISLPPMPTPVLVDWNANSLLSCLACGTYPVPGSTDTPPGPQPVNTAEGSYQPSGRVPIHSEPTKRVTPAYPELAKASGLNGEVAVEIVIDEKGKVVSAKEVSGPALLRQASINAALGWRFAPTRVDGSPTQAVGTIKFRFGRLADDSTDAVKANGGTQNSSSGVAHGRRP
jgi:TonB family protein